MQSQTLAACALSLACAGCVPPPEVRLGEARLAPHSRVLVPPFSDDRGLGREYARELAKGLWELGFDVVGEDQTAASFKTLRIRADDPLGPSTLQELRRLTRAEAAVVGHVSCPPGGAGRITVLVLEAGQGETALQADYRPRACGARADVGAATEDILRAIERALGAKARRPSEEDPL